MDAGAVLLVDARFHSSCENHATHRGQLSRWLRPQIQEFHPAESVRALKGFFAELEAHPPLAPPGVETTGAPSGAAAAAAYLPPGVRVSERASADERARMTGRAIDRSEWGSLVPVKVQRQDEAGSLAPVKLQRREEAPRAQSGQGMGQFFAPRPAAIAAAAAEGGADCSIEKVITAADREVLAREEAIDINDVDDVAAPGGAPPGVALPGKHHRAREVYPDGASGASVVTAITLSSSDSGGEEEGSAYDPEEEVQAHRSRRPPPQRILHPKAVVEVESCITYSPM